MKLQQYSSSIAALVLMHTGTNATISSKESSVDPMISMHYKPLIAGKYDHYYSLDIQNSMHEQEKISILQKFSNEILSNSQSLDKDILELLNESFWNLL